MKHAAIITEIENNLIEKHIEVEGADGKKIFLVEQEYTAAEMDLFNIEKGKWIIRCAGSMSFLADSDSGEDAEGHYCGYFDLVPSNAVFEKGRLVGYYFCAGSLDYSGNGRSSFRIEDWGYPGDNPFVSVSRGKKPHLFLFSETATHEWKDWNLLFRDLEKEYKSYLEF